MVLCGAPVCTVHHAEYTANFALDIIQATSKINDPSTGKSLKIRVGRCVSVLQPRLLTPPPCRYSQR